MFRDAQLASARDNYLAPLWPGVAQVCRITRRRMIRCVETVETVYSIASLPAERADAAKLLALSRDHWGIENRLHYGRDVMCREDQCRTHSRAAPQALAERRSATPL